MIKNGYSKGLRFLFCFGLSCLPCMGLQAMVVETLYEADMPYVTRDVVEREVLIQQSFIQVLEKVSGDIAIRDKEKIQNSLSQAGDYVDQYAYQESVLRTKFTPKLVNELLYEIDAAVWSKNRPVVMLWLAIEEGGDRYLLGGETEVERQQLLLSHAKMRGVPMLLPLLDLEDVAAVTVTDVWGQFPSVLKEASLRYASDAILVGRLLQRYSEGETQKWEATWQLLVDETTYSWSAEGSEMDDILKAGVAGVVEQMVVLYGIRSGAINREAVLVGVQNIQSAEDYGKALSYFEGLSHVQEVQIVRIHPDAVLFEVKPLGEGGRQILHQAIELDENLTQLALAPHYLSDAELLYRWIP